MGGATATVGGWRGLVTVPAGYHSPEKEKRDVALLTNGVTSVLSGELKPATSTLT